MLFRRRLTVNVKEEKSSLDVDGDLRTARLRAHIVLSS
jgi:hypothetical protein